MSSTFYFATEGDLVFGGPASKADDNLAAIRLLKSLQGDGRQASPDEQRILARYTGWGDTAVRNARWSETRDLVTNEEFYSIGESTVNAHFTALPVVAAIWDGVLRLGLGNLESIRVLDPSAGTGNFRSMMPVELRERSMWVEIELDLLTAGVLAQLHPEVPGRSKLYQSAFERTALPDGYFDLVISNVPFANVPVIDRSVDMHLRRSLHDYFLVKGLSCLRPGGLMAVITSRYTLDKSETDVRRWLADRANLLAAVRLPDSSFSKNAGTEVVTDVLFLQKRDGECADENDWVETVREDRGNREWWIYNKIYQDHPDWIIGEPASTGTMYRERSYTVVYPGEPGTEAARLRKKLLEVLPENLLGHGEAIAGTKDLPGVEPVRPAHVIPVSGDLPVDQRYRLDGLRQIYDTAKLLLAKETDGAEEAEIEALREQLNEVYDRYVMGFGRINSKANDRLLKNNPAFPFLRALEVRKNLFTVEKADIFSRSTVRSGWRKREVVSASDALFVCLDKIGRVDIELVASLASLPEDKAIEELKGMVFKRPDGTWETADRYLAGNILEKLEQARAAMAIDPFFAVNVEALTEAMPPPLKPTDIKARLGAIWIDPSIIEKFADYLIQGSPPPRIWYVASTGTWTVEVPSYARFPEYEMYTLWGTSRKSALALIDDALNLRTPLVYDELDDKRVLNKDATMAAQAKMEEIKARFQTWIWEDADRAELLAAEYNRRYNIFRRPRFDGAYLSLPGLSNDIQLWPYQLDAVCRCVQSQTALLGHEVGLGKTLISTVAAWEIMRLGIAHKSMVVVPNHLTEQWRKEILRAYPNANVLCASKDDMSKSRRGEFLSRIATGDWQYVIVPMSSFGLLPMGPEYQREFIEEEVGKLRGYLEEIKEERAPRSAIKEVTKAIKRYEARLDALADMKKDSTQTIVWEQLGVDLLIVDEFHLFKNLHFHTKMSRIAGLPNSRTERAFDLFMKVRYLCKTGGRLIGATATPVSNTLAEVFTLQRYMQYGTLESLGMNHFDAWASMFAEAVMLPEMTPDGAGFRINTRLARYINVPELSTLLSQFCEIRTWKDLEGVKVVSRPRLFRGKPSIVKLPSNAILKAFTQQFAERAEMIHRGGVDPRKDNMLKITGDGRKAALDIRLLTAKVPNEALPVSKGEVAATVIARIWKESCEFRSTQLVFCDLGTPAMNEIKNDAELPEGIEVVSNEADGDDRIFKNMYVELKGRLVESGIPEAEIAFIHDAKSDQQRSALFDAVNSGRVRVLVGSTEKMGTGMNVQERLIAIHHLDAPWRPADIEQRIGRMLRQGNRYPEVYAFVYITEESFDGYIWQILETKARFIEQVMSGQVDAREVDDVSDTVLSMGEIKALASGNPKVIRRVTLQNEIGKLESLHRAWLENRNQMRSRIKRHELSLGDSDQSIAFYERAIQTRNEHPAGNAFRMTLRDKIYSERKVAGELIGKLATRLKALSINRGQETRAEIGEFRGFKMYLSYRVKTSWVEQIKSDVEILLDFGETQPLRASIGESDIGAIQSIEAVLRNLDANLEKERERKAFLLKQNQTLVAGLEEPWPHEERYQEARKDLLLLDKELLGEGVNLPGMEPQMVDLDAGEAPVAEKSETPQELVDENFDMDAIVARIREIHAEMPPDDELVEVEAPIEALLISAGPVEIGSGDLLSWDQWLETYGLVPVARASAKRKVKVEAGQMSLF